MAKSIMLLSRLGSFLYWLKEQQGLATKVGAGDNEKIIKKRTLVFNFNDHCQVVWEMKPGYWRENYR